MSLLARDVEAAPQLPSFRVAWDTDSACPGYFDVFAPRLTHEAFWEFCQLNPDLNTEQDAEGRLVILPFAGWESSNRTCQVTGQLSEWNRHGEPGYVTGSATGYHLPNGATRAPSASWTRRDRIDALTNREREQFAPLCPDFVVELTSFSDRLPFTQAKMDEYLNNGAQLGLLIDRARRTVYVYRPGQTVQTLTDPATVTCDPEMPGLVFDMSRIF